MSFDLSKVISEVEGAIGLLQPAATLVAAIRDAAPAGTPASKILASTQAGLNSAVTAAGGIVTDVEAIWPHIQSILTAAEGVFGAFEGKAAAPSVEPATTN